MLARSQLRSLRRAANTFGFYLVGIDLRQNSEVHERTVGELFEMTCTASNYAASPKLPASPSCARSSRPRDLSFPKMPSARIRAMRQNQSIILRDAGSFSCLGRLSPTCSGRGAGLKSRTSFSGISSILF
jgi:hypothetical protein